MIFVAFLFFFFLAPKDSLQRTKPRQRYRAAKQEVGKDVGGALFPSHLCVHLLLYRDDYLRGIS